MTFKEFYIVDKDGKSNRVVRSLCKILNKEYDDVYNNLCKVAEDLKMDNDSYIVFYYDKREFYHMISINICL